MSKGPDPTTRRSPAQGGRELRARVSAEEYARVQAAADGYGMTVPAYVRGMVLGARYRDLLPAVMAATEPVELFRPLPMSALTRFGGRRHGGSCGCGGTLEQTRHENVAMPGWTLDCATCGASYDQDGNHWCPACETWPKRWVGGTDADPRPTCENCGADQPGWPVRPLVMAEAVESTEAPCLTCRNSVIRGGRYACRMTTDADVWRYLCHSGALASDDGLPTDRTLTCPGWAAKETT